MYKPLDEKSVVALPCIICGPPTYETPNGYRVLCSVINDSSSSYKEVVDKLPNDWKSPSNYQKGDFKVTIRSDIRPFSNVPYVFVGTIVNHQKYGYQFDAIDFYPDEPSNEKMMQEYLQRLPNVGIKRAKMIIKIFGVDKVGDVIENHLQQLVDAIPGITPDRAQIIQKKWKEDRNIRRVYMWIISHGISATFGKKIIEYFGERAIETLQKNPYALTEIRGIGFTKADEIAHKIMPEVPKDMRAKYCLIYILLEKRDEGHVCYPDRLLRSEALQLLSKRDDSTYGQYVDEALKSEFVILKDLCESTFYFYLPSLFYSEYDCASFLASMKNMGSLYSCNDSDVDYAEEKCSSFHSGFVTIKFDDNQRAAVKSAFTNKMTVLTGGGGTGKSTICHAICSIAESKGLHVTLFAPTGQAAKVLSNKTGKLATTIHRGLGLLPNGRRVSGVENNGDDFGIRSEILIIDEFSMVGIDILPYVFQAIRNPARTNIVFVGDPQQLPSVSPGNNLHDIIASGCANVVKLQRIYRQSDNSHITVIADKIAHGLEAEVPEVSDDFFFLDACNATHAMQMLSEFLQLFPDQQDVHEMQVITPQNKQECGVDMINAIMQEKYTAGSGAYVTHDQRVFYLGDRVMQIKNNYEKNVYNGNIGYVIDLGSKVVNPNITDQASSFITVQFEKNEHDVHVVQYISDEISQLKVAWCSTVHKFQGSQMPHVVFMMVDKHRHMMSKELVYTAFTRAQKRLDVIGSRNMMGYAAGRSEVKKRYTHLRAIYDRLAGNEDKIAICMNKSLLRKSDDPEQTID